MRKYWSRSSVKTGVLHGGLREVILLLLVAAGFISLLVSIFFSSGFNGFRAGVSDAFVPLVHAVSKPFHDVAQNIRDISGLASLQATNDRLTRENARLRDWYQTALRLEAENRSLKNLMNLKVDESGGYITAKILMDTGRSFVKTILVSGNVNDGVLKDQPVVSGLGLVGRIIDAGEKTSRVLLVTDINSRVPVIIENSNQHAILAGGNEALPRLIHLPEGSKVSAGARIVTSGYGGVFPKGLPVGTVVIDSTGAVAVDLFEDLERTSYVKIVQKSRQKPILNKVIE